MWQRSTSLASHSVAFGILLLATLALPSAARGQGRGSLQATATVVAASASIDGLHATQQAIAAWTSGGEAVSNNVSTVAQVEVAAVPASDRGSETLVVDVTYLKN
jgi:hypothetical protein